MRLGTIFGARTCSGYNASLILKTPTPNRVNENDQYDENASEHGNDIGEGMIFQTTRLGQNKQAAVQD